MWFARFPADVSLNRFAKLATEWAQFLGGTVWLAEDGLEACTYVQQAPGLPVPPGISLVQLEQTLVLHGQADGREARWHYVVATDVLPALEVDFNAWYDNEHLPGLAAVPGVSQAQRCLVVNAAGPRYHAAYDLAERQAFNSPAWLAVRSTPWSSRVRPGFLNTRRTMYRLLTSGTRNVE